jgi:hypothetical protein
MWTSPKLARPEPLSIERSLCGVHYSLRLLLLAMALHLS